MADLVEILSDGQWHTTLQLVQHPPYPAGAAVEAWVNVLESDGYGIEREGDGLDATYRLVAYAD